MPATCHCYPCLREVTGPKAAFKFREVSAGDPASSGDLLGLEQSLGTHP